MPPISPMSTPTDAGNKPKRLSLSNLRRKSAQASDLVHSPGAAELYDQFDSEIRNNYNMHDINQEPEKKEAHSWLTVCIMAASQSQT